MKISRYGHGSYRGTKSIELKNPDIKWNPKTATIQIEESDIYDFTTTSRHNYCVELTLEELSTIFEKAVKDGLANSPEKVSESFAKNTDSLLMILRKVSEPPVPDSEQNQ